MAELVRLQKALAAAGVASRRASENLIAEGRVEVNGELIIEMGRKVDPTRDEIRVDGSRVPPPRRNTYLVLNKPRGVLTTIEDPQGRTTVADYLPAGGPRLFHVGRLDADTQGLLLLTNDGEFTHRLTHPSYEVPKVYLAEVLGSVTNKTVDRLISGVRLDDGPIAADSVTIKGRAEDRTLVQITLHSGRNRIVRRMLDAVGHPVEQLSRQAIGPVKLGRLKSGETRELTDAELGALLDLVSL